MTEKHDSYRDWAAAYILDALEPCERRDYQGHLRSCEECRRRVQEFSFLPDALSRPHPDLDAGHALVTKRVVPSVAASAGPDFRHLRRVGRRWRIATLVISAATLVLLVALGINATSTPVGLTGTQLVFDQTTTNGTIVIDERAWGTNIEVNLEELPRRDVYQLWAIDTSGKWSNAGTWSATPSATVILTAATAVATVEIDRVVVTSADRDEILLDASV